MSLLILKGQENKSKQLFVLYNKPAVENRVKYFSGDYPKNVISGNPLKNQEILKQRIVNALQNDTLVITDCINRPITISRETFVNTKNKTDLFDGYNQTKTDSVATLTGRYYIIRISVK